MNIRYKLTLLLVLPLLGVVYLGSQSYLSDRRYSSEMQELSDLTGLAVKISNVIHESQKERGYTAGFLASKGEKFGSALRQQHQQTDDRIEELKTCLAQLDLTNYGQRFENDLNDSLATLKEIGSNRSAVSNLAIPAPAAIGFYTGLHSKFLDIISSITSYSSDPELAVAVNAYANFLNSKERSGIERAVVTGAFAQDAFSPAMYERFLKLVAVQDAYLREFQNHSTKSSWRFYEQTLNSGCVSEVLRMREVAKRKGTQGGFNVNPDMCFSTYTKKINLLKKVEDKLAERLEERAAVLRVTAEQAAMKTMLLSGGIMLTAFLAGLFVIRSIIQPISNVIEMLKDIATGEGDVTKRIQVSSKDEIGVMVGWFNKFLDKLQKTMQSVANNSCSVGTSASQLNVTAMQLAQDANDSMQRSSEVAQAAKEMTSTIDEIAQTTERSTKVASEAVALVESSNRHIGDLEEAAGTIGEVVQVIQDIAGQTNLLALNATIEAARAGAAGKGFAVVAEEVKELARQTSSATDEIRNRIESIQLSAAQTIESIKEVAGVISSVEKGSLTIAAAVDEQRATADAMADSIQNVAEAAKRTSLAATDTQRAGEHMNQMALNLNDTLSQFKTGAPPCGISSEAELSTAWSQNVAEAVETAAEEVLSA